MRSGVAHLSLASKRVVILFQIQTHRIGFAMHRRPVHSKRNNRLNVLIAGSGGCGKSTLINALCGGHEVANTSAWLDLSAHQANQPRSLTLKTYTEDMADPYLGSVTLRMVETQGFGDNLDNSQHITDIVKYIEGQYDEVLAEESRIKRNPRFTDNRVHAVVYMIEPTGHGLREQDISFMSRVGEVANVIPVLAKADSLTPPEVLTNKRLVFEDIEHYKIPIYQFVSPEAFEHEPQDEEEEERLLALRRLHESLPFSIVASSKTINLNDRPTLVREYPWGMLLIEDPKVSEFSLLREILLLSRMEDLKETTNDYLYERYRTQRLSEDPAFNAAVSAASAPTTASRANLAGIANGTANPYTASPPHAQAAGPHSQPAAGRGPLDQAAGLPPHNGQVPHGQPLYAPYPGQHSQPGSRTVSGQEYVNRENRLFEEEELLHKDEKLVQSELEMRRQELRRRELELQRLEERLRKESKQFDKQQMNASQSLQQQMDKLAEHD